VYVHTARAEADSLRIVEPPWYAWHAPATQEGSGHGLFALEAMGHHPHVCYGNLFTGAKMPRVTRTERPSDSEVDARAPTQTGAGTCRAQPRSCATCERAHRGWQRADTIGGGEGDVDGTLRPETARSCSPCPAQVIATPVRLHKNDGWLTGGRMTLRGAGWEGQNARRCRREVDRAERCPP
jgi:hypothetical protein